MEIIDNKLGFLKMKEISYIHSEAYAAGELKHVTISLIEDGILVIGIATQDELYEKTVSNMVECKARGAYFIRVEFPNSGILLLRGKGDFDKAMIEIVTPGGSVEYPVMVRRMSGLSIDEIFAKHLYMLLPFYIFNLEGELDLINENGEELEKFSKFYIEIIERLESEMTSGYLSQFSYGVIISLVHKVAYKMTMKREVVQKKVGDIMGGKVLDLDIIRARHDGLAAGEIIGEERGEARGVERGRKEEREDNIKKLAASYMNNDSSLTEEKAMEMARAILE